MSVKGESFYCEVTIYKKICYEQEGYGYTYTVRSFDFIMTYEVYEKETCSILFVL